MKFPKKSLGQNFLIDKNIVKKIVNLIKIYNENIIEIGPGKGALTSEIIKKEPNSLILIEKDKLLADYLKAKYEKNKIIKVINEDILKVDLNKIIKKKYIVFGNLPYNISSQIFVKFLRFKNWPPKFSNLVFMFQKELGLKIIGRFLSSTYGRLSILFHSRFKLEDKFLISPNCFFPRPKVTSIVLHIKPKLKTFPKFKDIKNLEKITNILFSNKRKMINKNVKKIFKNEMKNKIKFLNLNLRPSEIEPKIYYKITRLYEKN